MTQDAQTDDRHREKMAKRKAAQDAEVAGKTIEKGLLIVHTGTGKGKSTAAFGLLLRAVGRGQKAGVVQFIKGAWSTGERIALERFGDMVECMPSARASPGRRKTRRATSRRAKTHGRPRRH